MFDPTTLIWCASGDVALSSLISNMALEHVIVRPVGRDGSPRDYEFRHLKIVPNAIQSGMGTTITVQQGKNTYSLTCSRRTRLWVEMPTESWVSATEIQIGDNVTVFNGFGSSANGIGKVTSVVDIPTMSGHQLVISNETSIPLAVYASGMLVSIPY